MGRNHRHPPGLPPQLSPRPLRTRSRRLSHLPTHSIHGDPRWDFDGAVGAQLFFLASAPNWEMLSGCIANATGLLALAALVSPGTRAHRNGTLPEPLVGSLLFDPMTMLAMLR
jgi:hypothetical protein